MLTDLREDKQFFMDHPGACTISTAQVFCNVNTCFHACVYIVEVAKYLQNLQEMENIFFSFQKMQKPYSTQSI